ncbi:hypothetical protein C1646_675703 [Rhizophagus diaphanus]|nr:hypothetical protein C1646_675703 [Rhizophagus diaphanus] [Rhizophagus sp. MUCL 43196]
MTKVTLDLWEEFMEKNFKTILDTQDDYVQVYKVGRSTGYTKGLMAPSLQYKIISKLFGESDKLVKTLIVRGVNGQNGDHGDSDALVYDQYGALWGFMKKKETLKEQEKISELLK